MMDDLAVVTPKKYIVGLVLVTGGGSQFMLSMTWYPASPLTTRLRKP